MGKRYEVERASAVTYSADRQCTRKKKYTKKAAQEAANAAAFSGRAKRFRIYECVYCKGWHLAHLNK